MAGVRVVRLPSQFVHLKIASSSNPAHKKREPPVQIGGHLCTMNLVPVLFPPHKNTANTRLATSIMLFLLPDTGSVLHEFP